MPRWNLRVDTSLYSSHSIHILYKEDMTMISAPIRCIPRARKSDNRDSREDNAHKNFFFFRHTSDPHGPITPEDRLRWMIHGRSSCQRGRRAACALREL